MSSALRGAGVAGTPRPHRRVRASFLIATLLAGSLLMLPITGAGRIPGFDPGPGWTPALVTLVKSTTVAYQVSTIYYHSSVDHFLLSYYETLPSPFNSSHTFHLAVELHGLTLGTVTVSGGTGGGFAPATAQAAVNDGFLLIDLNTRTGSGWYVNSNYTGPQEQDVLDAITHEQSLRHIDSVYLFGTSMGSIGTLSIGLDHPKLFQGLGVIASFPDYFEMFAYWMQNYSTYAPYMLLPTGGLYPNASAYARAIFIHLSPLRLHPQRLSGLPLYMTNGALDSLATNNLTQWPFLQANNTIVNRTCLVAASFGEPANCTMPLATLSALHPGSYHYRYVYEPNGPHSYYLLNATDMFDYFLGKVPDGTYWGTYPVPSPVNPPRPLVTIATKPLTCGTITLGNRTAITGDALGLAPGNYSVAFSPCGHRSVSTVTTQGGVTYHPGTHLLTVTQSGSVVVAFRSPASRRPSP